MTSAGIKLPSIAELTAFTNLPEVSRSLDVPYLSSISPKSAPLSVPLSKIPRESFQFPQSMSLPTPRPSLSGPSRQNFILPPSLPSISLFAAYHCAPIDPLYYAPAPGYAVPTPAQVNHIQPSFKKCVVYQLPASLASMSPSLSFVSTSQNNSPMLNEPVLVQERVHKCQRCGTTETPEWRRGPNGLRTLCNACGLFHAKLVKKKGAVAAAAEVLNNKVYKGSNGRRVTIKKAHFDQEYYRSLEKF